MKRMDQGRTPRVARHHAGKGQSLTELALITPLLAIILLGIVEISGAFGAQIDLRNAAYQAARIGALQGNGGLTAFTCPNTTSGITDTVDMTIVKTILGAQSVDPHNIASIQVYKAGVNPGTVAYSGTTRQLNQYNYPFISGTSLITSTYNWPSCMRSSSEPPDALGVHLSYRYHPIMSLFGNNTITINGTSVMRLNPTKTDSPCPVPQAPTDVAAHWTGTEPSSTDAIIWTAVPNATSYKIYAGVNGSAVGSTPVYTVTGPPASGPVTATYAFNPPFPAASQVSYMVKGNNYCGDGDISDPVPDGQYALPITPTIITATAAGTPGNDYVSWIAVPDAQSYTITQTATGVGAGAQVVSTVAAPVTSTVIADLYHKPLVSTVTYAVAATSLSAVRGPSATAVVTPTAPPLVTVDDAVTSTILTNFFTYGGAGNQWVHCGPGPTSCYPETAGVLASGSYSNTLSITPNSGDTVAVQFTGTQITLYGALQPNGGQASVTLSNRSPSPPLPPIDFYAGTSVENTPVFTSTLLTPGTHTLTLTILSSHSGPSPPLPAYYVGIDRAVVQQ